MAKKYNHDKQNRSKGKSEDKKSAERPAKFVVSHSANPDENRSHPKSERQQKKAKAAADKANKDERPRRFGSDDKYKSSSRPFTKSTGSKSWESRPPRDSSERPASGRSYDKSKPSSEEKRPYKDYNDRPSAGRSRDEFKPRSEEKRPYKDYNDRPSAGRSRDEFKPRSEEKRPYKDYNDRPSAGRSRDEFKPRSEEKRPYKDYNDRPSAERSRDEFKHRSEDERPFSKREENFKKRDDRKGKNADAKTNEARSNRADKGRRPRYNEDVMKSKLSTKILDKVKKQESTHTDGTIRLNRYIANAGVCSRREADELIADGKVTVNGKVVTELGSRVMPEDIVTYNGNALERENYVYVLLNKPKDFLTTTDDPAERKTVMDIVAEAADERIYPVGRLDRKTTGLLLLTNDGKLAEKLSHPSNHISKIYQAELDKPITEEDFDAIVKGFELEDGFVKVDELALVTPDAEVVGIKIHSGKNRIVRRIFEHFGYKVQKLDRTVYAGLNKKDLPRGKWRYLSEKEVIKLKYLS
ncbi:MAG: 23S rRNA pseudouridine2605 synthase [Spirosomataceae bacterium]|jgi:23S rRNA pseudouridine2605 synthase